MTWSDGAKVEEYLGRIDRVAARAAGEAALVELLPDAPERLLDLGCGDGRLAGLVLDARPSVTRAVAIDRSPPMLDRARERFAGDGRVAVREGDLADPIDGTYDVITSGFAIHHLEHEAKRGLFARITSALAPRGLFANLEVVQCATEALQEEFLIAIGRPGGDPEDRLATVDEQLAWMRDAGLDDVDCMWRWRGFALLAGRGPA